MVGGGPRPGSGEGRREEQCHQQQQQQHHHHLRLLLLHLSLPLSILVDGKNTDEGGDDREVEQISGGERGR